MWTSHKTAQLLDATYYQKFLQSVPVYLECNVLHWAYIQDMGRWSEEDILIPVDVDYRSYCDGAYGGPNNMRVAADTGCDAKERRFYFFADRDIEAGEEIIYNYGEFVISSVWAEFVLYTIKIYHG